MLWRTSTKPDRSKVLNMTEKTFRIPLVVARVVRTTDRTSDPQSHVDPKLPAFCFRPSSGSSRCCACFRVVTSVSAVFRHQTKKRYSRSRERIQGPRPVQQFHVSTHVLSVGGTGAQKVIFKCLNFTREPVRDQLVLGGSPEQGVTNDQVYCAKSLQGEAPCGSAVCGKVDEMSPTPSPSPNPTPPAGPPSPCLDPPPAGKTRRTRKNRRHFQQWTSHCSCLEHCFLFLKRFVHVNGQR